MRNCWCGNSLIFATRVPICHIDLKANFFAMSATIFVVDSCFVNKLTYSISQATQNHDVSIISRYNLRARSITPVNSPSSSGVAASSSVSRSKKNKTPQVKSPPLKFEHGKGLFSSDEDGT